MILGPYDTAGIHAGDAFADQAAITSTNPHPDAIGLSGTHGAVALLTAITGLPVGVHIDTTNTNPTGIRILGSTIIATEIDIRSIGPVDVFVGDSTLGGPVGIAFGQDSLVEFRHATILGDAALPLDGANEGSIVLFEKTLANTCSAVETAESHYVGPAFIDLGGNAGTCFAGSEFATTAPLADNGCVVGSPDSCALTAAIDTTSSAHQASTSCSNSDQRGVSRPPYPAPCDAGAYEIGCASPSFFDVAHYAYYEPAVAWAFCTGVTTGTSNITFSPIAPITRAEFATMLWRHAGEPTAPAHPFTDVPTNTYYEPAVAWIANTNITTGTTPTTYNPNAPATRAQAVTFLWRYATFAE